MVEGVFIADKEQWDHNRAIVVVDPLFVSESTNVPLDDFTFIVHIGRKRNF